VGCLIVLLLSGLALGGCAARYYQSTEREPEIPINQFLRKQLEALPPGWSFQGVDVSDIETDTDFTWARWAIASGFQYKATLETYRRDQISEEIHVFWNPFAARIILSPSPSSVYAGEGYVPKGWSYHPPHASRFEFGCEDGDGIAQPEWCSLILRYDEYVIVFSTPIADYMTLDDLKRVLEVIDQEMSTYLQHSTLRPGPREVPSSLDE
jgi:hypothetical protein